MRFALGVLVLGAGCKGILGIESGVVGGDAPQGSDAPLADAPEDAMVDGPPPDAANCFGTFQPICLTELPDDDYLVTTPVLMDTLFGCDEAMAIGGVEMCIRSARQINIGTGALFSVIGSRFLVLVATEEIRISGTLDSWSSGSTSCPTNQGGFTSGGAGGSFGTIGGKGGGALGSMPGPAATPPTTFRRGCPGDEGGSDPQGGDGGAGGSGIFLVAPSIHLAGTARINASGYGGGGGNNDRGGGGGGSGGFILLDSTTLTIDNDAVLLAVGGGGGGGGGGGMAIAGTRATPGAPVGLGGAGNAPASGDGGDGGGENAGMPGEAGNSIRGSGGGGGGTGVILVTAAAPTLGGTIRPMPITP